MSSARIPILVALGLMVSTMGALGILTANDAGSGSDAPDDRDRALGLEPGVYRGNLTPEPDRTRDADWYEAEPASKDASTQMVGKSKTTSFSCTLVNATSLRPIELLVEEPAVDGAEVDTTVGGAHNESIGLVGPTASGVLAGFVAPTPATIAAYQFELDRTPISQIPTSQAEPAPMSPQPITSPCFGDDIEEGDTRDSWTFSADEDERVLLTFISDGDRSDRLSLVGPEDQVTDHLSSAGSIQVSEIDLNSTGTWQIDVEAAQSTVETQQTYAVGISILEDPGEEEEEKRPCRPHCME